MMTEATKLLAADLANDAGNLFVAVANTLPKKARIELEKLRQAGARTIVSVQLEPLEVVVSLVSPGGKVRTLERVLGGDHPENRDDGAAPEPAMH